jgi:hypothetical protein
MGEAGARLGGTLRWDGAPGTHLMWR